MPKHVQALEKMKGKKNTRNTESQYQNTTWDTDEFSSPSHRRTHEGRCCSCTGSKDRDHSWVWTRLLCAHRSEQATPLKDTSTYSHTLKKLSTHIKANLSGSLIAWHLQIHGSECKLNLPLTQTPFTTLISTRIPYKNTNCCSRLQAVENTVSLKGLKPFLALPWVVPQSGWHLGRAPPEFSQSWRFPWGPAADCSESSPTPRSLPLRHGNSGMAPAGQSTSA